MAKSNHTPLPRYGAWAGPAVLGQGFRPFFLLSGLWAIVALALSVEMILGRIALPTAFDAITWHAHEMLFGYIAATVAGFLLTAIPNWTGRLPLQGLPLLGLVLLWLAGRVAVAFSATIGAGPAALIDLAFLAALLGVVLREIVAGRNWRNLPMAVALGLFLLGNALFHAAALGLDLNDGLARRGAIAVIIALITLVGGRIVPSFTRNWLVKRGATALPVAFGAVDKAALAATLAALAFWVGAPESALGGGLAAVAAAMLFWRLARWRGLATGAEPLVWVLHLGYLWVPLGLALLGLSQWLPAVSPTGALHALTAGAMGTMTLAVMSRATLGHSGRPLHAGPGLAAAYLLVTAAAVLRVAAALLATGTVPLLTAASLAWIAAFALFLAVCGPLLLGRRPPS